MFSPDVLAPIAPQAPARAAYGPILALDMSSTCIGWALHDGATITTYGHVDLGGDIAARCNAAQRHVATLLDLHLPALVVMEDAVGQHVKAILPQARVSGAVLALLSQRQALWALLAPSEAKRALTGKGNADKRAMVEAAAALLGINVSLAEFGVYRSKARLIHAGGALTEDEADAVGLALAGLAVKVERKAA